MYDTDKYQDCDAIIDPHELEFTLLILCITQQIDNGDATFMKIVLTSGVDGEYGSVKGVQDGEHVLTLQYDNMVRIDEFLKSDLKDTFQKCGLKLICSLHEKENMKMTMVIEYDATFP